MITWKPFVALAALILGVLQAWDSGAFHAGSTVAILATAGVLLPGVTLLLSARPPIWITSLIASALLLLAARLMAPTSLNGLHLALMAPAMYVLFAGMATHNKPLEKAPSNDTAD